MQSNANDTINHIPWVTSKLTGYFFLAEPLIINASPDVVWSIVKDVEKYHDYSKGCLTASLPHGELKVDNAIHLVLYEGKPVGHFIPASMEKITVVDDQKHILAWQRPAPFHSGNTECYRVLKPVDDGKKTILYLALKIPGSAGFFTSALLKKRIEHAFNEVNEGIKAAAEQKQLEINTINTIKPTK